MFISLSGCGGYDLYNFHNGKMFTTHSIGALRITGTFGYADRFVRWNKYFDYFVK